MYVAYYIVNINVSILLRVVVNDSVFVFVGEPVTVGEGVRVTIDCSQLIDEATNNGSKNFTITWYNPYGTPHNDSCSTYFNVSADSMQLIFPNTSVSLAIDGHLVVDGNYTCEVCGDTDACINRSTLLYVCSE